MVTAARAKLQSRGLAPAGRPTPCRWLLGQHLRRIAAEAALAGRKPGMRQVAAPLGVTTSTGNLAGYLFDAFPIEADLSRLLDAHRGDGRPVAISTVAVICRPAFGQHGEALLERAAGENWTDAVARARLRSAGGAARAAARRGGRRPVKPSSPADLPGRWRVEDARYLNVLESLGRDSVISGLLQRDAAGVTAEALAVVRAASQKLIAGLLLRSALLERIEAHQRLRAGPTAKASDELADTTPRDRRARR